MQGARTSTGTLPVTKCIGRYQTGQAPQCHTEHHRAQMKTIELVLENLRNSFVKASDIAGLGQPPSKYLVVVDRYGEDMLSETSVPTLSNDEAHEFAVGLCEWLDQESARLKDFNVSDALASMMTNADSFLDGKNQSIRKLGRCGNMVRRSEEQRIRLVRVVLYCVWASDLWCVNL